MAIAPVPHFFFGLRFLRGWDFRPKIHKRCNSASGLGAKNRRIEKPHSMKGRRSLLRQASLLSVSGSMEAKIHLIQQDMVNRYLERHGFGAVNEPRCVPASSRLRMEPLLGWTFFSAPKTRKTVLGREQGGERGAVNNRRPPLIREQIERCIFLSLEENRKQHWVKQLRIPMTHYEIWVLEVVVLHHKKKRSNWKIVSKFSKLPQWRVAPKVSGSLSKI